MGTRCTAADRAVRQFCGAPGLARGVRQHARALCGGARSSQRWQAPRKAPSLLVLDYQSRTQCAIVPWCTARTHPLLTVRVSPAGAHRHDGGAVDALHRALRQQHAAHRLGGGSNLLHQHPILGQGRLLHARSGRLHNASGAAASRRQRRRQAAAASPCAARAGQRCADAADPWHDHKGGRSGRGGWVGRGSRRSRRPGALASVPPAQTHSLGTVSQPDPPSGGSAASAPTWCRKLPGPERGEAGTQLGDWLGRDGREQQSESPSPASWLACSAHAAGHAGRLGRQSGRPPH